MRLGTKCGEQRIQNLNSSRRVVRGKFATAGIVRSRKPQPIVTARIVINRCQQIVFDVSAARDTVRNPRGIRKILLTTLSGPDSDILSISVVVGIAVAVETILNCQRPDIQRLSRQHILDRR